jgi:hypothetical protein
MSDLNYGSGFYLIEVTTNQYDLFNSVTDKRILMDEPKEKIINFLELNLPTHPFLYQIDQETGLYLPEDKSSNRLESSFFYPSFNYNHNDYTGTASADYLPEFYSPFDSDADYSGGFVERYDVREEDDPVQLEFNFAYENSKGKETIPYNISPNNEEIVNEYFGEDIPYLPDDTGGDTD